MFQFAAALMGLHARAGIAAAAAAAAAWEGPPGAPSEIVLGLIKFNLSLFVSKPKASMTEQIEAPKGG